MNPLRAPERLRRLQVEITTACNLKCQACQRTIGLEQGRWANKHMTPEVFARVLAHMPPSDVLILQGIGEPTLSPHLPALLETARAAAKHPVISFNTNALAQEPEFYRDLMGKGLSHVSVSVDSFDQKIADLTRAGTDVEALKRNLAAIRGLGIALTVSVVAAKANVDSLASLLDDIAALGCPFVEIQPVIDYDGGSPAALDAAGIAKVNAVATLAEARHPGLKVARAASLTADGSKCRRPVFAPYVTVDGLLTPCCTTNDVALFGSTSVAEMPFAEAWNRPAVVEWCSQFLAGEPAICRSCSFNPSGSYGNLAKPKRAAPVPVPPAKTAAPVSAATPILDVAVATEEAARLQREGRLDEAEALLTPALGAGATAEALFRLGTILFQKSDNRRARAMLEAAAAIQPTSRIRNNLACVLQALGQKEDALRLASAIVAQDPDYPNAYATLAGLLDDVGRAPAANEILAELARRSIEARLNDMASGTIERLLRRPGTRTVCIRLAHNWRVAGERARALALLDRLLATEPDDLSARLAHAVAQLPYIYETATEMTTARKAFATELEDFRKRLETAPAAARAQAAVQVGLAKPFFLSYQGEDDKALLTIYGQAVSLLMRSAYPNLAALPATPPPQPGERIRVGFASAYFGFHSVSKLFRGWVRHLDRSRFEVFVYDLSGSTDAWIEETKSWVHGYRKGRNNTDTAEWATRIFADRPHALIYPEIGLESHAVRLATLRLAPIQAVSWGHPVTSGLSTVDYFLSSALMEPEDGDEHYTEKLVRLPGLSICYQSLPTAPDASLTRAEVGLRDNAVVYICCQTHMKYRPQDDALLARIAAKVPRAQFLFIGAANSPTTAVLTRRLTRAFAKEGVDATDRLVIGPPVPPGKFPALLALADIYLDSISWSGGNTSLEAATAELPMITTPGRFMRGRHTAAVLKVLGLEEFIAPDFDAYVELAVRLGKNPRLRRSARERIAAAKERLFNDLSGVRALETFLEGAARKA